MFAENFFSSHLHKKGLQNRERFFEILSFRFPKNHLKGELLRYLTSQPKFHAC